MKTACPRRVEGVSARPRPAPVGRPQGAGTLAGGSCGGRRLDHVANPNQVVQRGREGEQPPDPADAAVADLVQQGHRLHPAEHLFDPLALLLADRIAGMPGRPRIGRTGAAGGVLRDMRREAERAERRDEAAGVVALVGAQGGAAPQVGGHRDRRLPLGDARGLAHAGITGRPWPNSHREVD